MIKFIFSHHFLKGIFNYIYILKQPYDVILYRSAELHNNILPPFENYLKKNSIPYINIYSSEYPFKEVPIDKSKGVSIHSLFFIFIKSPLLITPATSLPKNIFLPPRLPPF